MENADPTVFDLLQEGVPALSKANATIQSTAHVENIGHDDAAVLEQAVDLPDELPFTVGGTETKSSDLLRLRGLKDGFTYQNETKVQNLVMRCLNDALTLLDLSEDFLVESEFAIFSYRPDIVVVSHSMLGIILVVEVKKPGAEVFTSHEPGGQVYDYLLGNLLAGVSHPFAVLTTYDEMVIAHLEDNVSKEILRSNVDNLGCDFPDEVLNLLQLTGGEKSEGSPESKLNKVFECTGSSSEENSDGSDDEDVDYEGGDDEGGDDEGGDDEGGDDEDSDEDENYKRAVVYTPTFHGTEIMKALILAIRCGLESVARSQPRTVPKQGASANGTCALVNEEGIVWTNLPSTIRFTYDQFPGSTTQKLYLWRDLGRGARGRVFLACNSQGKACAVKFYLIDDNLYHRQESPQEAREEWRKNQMVLKEAEARSEKEYWLDVHGKEFDGHVRVMKWNKLWCLMMPYFDPLAIERREHSLPAVEKFLEKCKRKGLRYRDEDLRWRHVGTRGNDVFVFDLGSLEKCENEGDFDIQGQIDLLRTKITD